ncbi:MAG TPA: long-chain fatty acid--CoA ligase, partial [Steroidobacteraceae bacterium]|nr:long-chain fatty acid--CoA ligase [Steroidobacteraceae bacterium]
MDRFWLKSYPPGVPADVDVSQYRSLPHLMTESFRKYAGRDAFISMDHALTYADVDRLSSAFGAWLQAKGLERGARVA